MILITRRWRLLCLIATLFIAGCAVPARSKVENTAENPVWHGRLAVQVEGDTPQSFFASFELRGHARRGELNLYSPLGTTVARLRWTPRSATLLGSGETRTFTSLDALALEATGTPLPVAALFDWLAGHEASDTHWQADLSQRAEGRLSARRQWPEPSAEIRLVLEP